MPSKQQGRTFITITYNEEPLSLPGDTALVFVNLFDYVDFDRTKVKGALFMRHNGAAISYTRPVNDGDDIIIKWI